VPPVFVGANCELADGVHLHGPVVIDDGCRIGASATLRDSVVLPDVAIAPKSLVAGAILGTKT
jgi:mannose-1-phosphate guanylyltransferase/phosphomannomutase